mmetsp:Transcript_27797/g.46126  ORF Transcript_27797/g.46126 Transcript_27797/m.46126 type:complete len:105 (-) Transcript_27797:20-334(-)
MKDCFLINRALHRQEGDSNDLENDGRPLDSLCYSILLYPLQLVNDICWILVSKYHVCTQRVTEKKRDLWEAISGCEHDLGGLNRESITQIISMRKKTRTNNHQL